MEEEITRATNKIDKTTIALNVNIDKEHIVMLNNIEDIDSLTNYQNAFEVKQIETLKMKSSNFSKFADNFLIIKRLYEDENKSIDFIAKWLRISKYNLQLWISRYFKHLDKYDDEITKHKIKEERSNKIRDIILEFFDINKRRCVTVCQMVEYINNGIFKEDISNQTNYYEVYSCLKNVMNFGWRKASQRPPRWFQSWLEEARKMFQNFINKLREAGFVIVWIDESSFSSSALPLYSWMKRGWDAERVIRPSSQRFNVIAAQWNKEAYFMMKSKTTNKDQFWEFIKLLDKQLISRLAKITYERRMVVMFDNASIHKTKEVKLLVKKLGWVVFTIPPYSPELNQIEHTFGILKSKMSKRNFNAKTIMQVVKEEIKCLYKAE